MISVRVDFTWARDSKALFSLDCSLVMSACAWSNSGFIRPRRPHYPPFSLQFQNESCKWSEYFSRSEMFYFYSMRVRQYLGLKSRYEQSTQTQIHTGSCVIELFGGFGLYSPRLHSAQLYHSPAATGWIKGWRCTELEGSGFHPGLFQWLNFFFMVVFILLSTSRFKEGKKQQKKNKLGWGRVNGEVVGGGRWM